MNLEEQMQDKIEKFEQYIRSNRDSAKQDIYMDDSDNTEYNRGKVRAFEIVLAAIVKQLK